MQHFINEHPRNKVFIERGKVMKFSELHQPAQDALIHYMSVDGAAWAVEKGWKDWKWGEGQPSTLSDRDLVMKDIEKFRPRFIQEFGDKLFGLVFVSADELYEAMKGDEDYSEGRYSKDIVSSGKIGGEYDVPTWPVILSAFPDETLQDGWNRFGRYYELNMMVPVIWYAD